MEGWAQQGKLAYRVPVKWVLVGVLGESSGFDSATYVWTVRAPLFVPFEALNLSYSTRVGGGAHAIKDADIEPLKAAVLAASADVQDEGVALEALAALSLDTPNVRVFETVAFAQLLLHDGSSAMATLAMARQLPRRAGEPIWVDEVLTRMTGIENLLRDGLEGDAVRQLDDWAAGTATALRVDRDG